MVLGILLHRAESTVCLGPIQILKQNFGFTNTQRLVLFLMSKVFVNTTFMESKFRTPQLLATRPMYRWSPPEAEIVMWISYDTENQKIFLSEIFLKKLFKNLSKNKRRNIPKVKGPKTILLFIREFGRICQPMLRIQVGNPSQIFVSKLVRHKHSRERETDGAIHWTIRCLMLIIGFHKWWKQFH